MGTSVKIPSPKWQQFKWLDWKTNPKSRFECEAPPSLLSHPRESTSPPPAALTPCPPLCLSCYHSR